MTDQDTRQFRAAALIAAAERDERRAETLRDKAREYRELATRLLGGTAGTPEPR